MIAGISQSYLTLQNTNTLSIEGKHERLFLIVYSNPTQYIKCICRTAIVSCPLDWNSYRNNTLGHFEHNNRSTCIFTSSMWFLKICPKCHNFFENSMKAVPAWKLKGVFALRGYYVSVLQKLTGYRRIPCQEWVSPRGVSRAVKRTFLTGDSPIPCQFL